MKKNWKTSALAGLLAVSMVWGCACSSSESTKKGKNKGEDETEEVEYVINTLPKKNEAEDVQSGLVPFSDEGMDISFCYPRNWHVVYTDDGEGLRLFVDDDEFEEIEIRKMKAKNKSPEDIMKSIKKELDGIYGKLKASDIEVTKVGKRSLYMKSFTSDDVAIDVYVEIYEKFAMVYTVYAEEAGALEADLNTILSSMYFNWEAYNDVEVPTEAPETTTYLESTDYNLGITVPIENASPDPNCPAGVYVSYPNGNIGAIFLNSDPIGSCVYDAEDLLNSFMWYEGMMAALLLLDTAEVSAYYDSSFNGTPEIDADFTFTSNGQSGVGYCRLINGPDIGCYCVFYTLYEPDNTEQKELFSTALETFQVNGAPQQRKFEVHEVPCGIRFVLPTDLYASIQDDAANGTSVVYIDQERYVLVGPMQDQQTDLDGYINSLIANYDLADNHQYELIPYDDSRLQARLIRGHYDYEGATYYYSFGITILGDNKPYACAYNLPTTDTEAMDTVIDYILWSINQKPA